MSDFTPLALRSALVGVLVLSGVTGAQALTIKRCNILKDGSYRPALVVEKAGERHIHHIGEDGLTRSMVFNGPAAVKWAEALYGADPGRSTSFGVCGAGGASGRMGGGGNGCF